MLIEVVGIWFDVSRSVIGIVLSPFDAGSSYYTPTDLVSLV